LKKIFLLVGALIMGICLSCPGCGSTTDVAEIQIEPETQAESNDMGADPENSAADGEKKDGNEEQASEMKNAEVSYVGIYTAQLSLRDYLPDADVHTLESAGLKTVADVSVPLIFVLEEDGTCNISGEPKAWEKELTESLLADADRYLTEVFHWEGVKEEKFDKVARNAGYSGYENLKSVFSNDYRDEYVRGFEQEVYEFKVVGTYTVSDNLVTFLFPEEAKVVAAQSDNGFEVSFEFHGKMQTVEFNK